MSTQVVILGIGRSGTSMLAGICHRLGIFMGDDLLAAGPANPMGYYEDLEMMRLIGRIVGTSTWPMPDEPIPPDVERELRALIAKRNANHEWWGWKIVQTALIAWSIHPLLSNPRYILIERDMAAVLASWQRAWDIPPKTASFIARMYRTAHLNFLADKEYLQLSYEGLLEHRYVCRIADFVGLYGADISAAKAFIKPELNHFTKEPVSQ